MIYGSLWAIKNGNKYDIRNCNVVITHQCDKIIREKYKITNYINGHFENNGIDAYISINLNPNKSILPP